MKPSEYSLEYLFRNAIRSRLNLVLLLVFLALTYAKWIQLSAFRDRTIDFAVYYIAAEALAQGENPYTLANSRWDELARSRGLRLYTRPYYYPPLTASLVRLISDWDPRTSAAIWLALSTLAFAGAAWMLARTSNLPESTLVAFALVGGFYPVPDTLSHGQVNGFLLLAVCGAYHALHRGADRGLGAWIALGIHLKIVPVVHLAFLVVRRRWKAVAASIVVGVALMLAAVPLFGWQGGFSFFSVVAKAGSGPLVSYGSNQALSGPIARSLEAYPRLANALWMLSASSMLLVTGWLCWKRKEGGGSLSITPRRFALVTLTALLVFPYTWYHQLCLLVIPLFQLVDGMLAQRRRLWLIPPLALGYVVTGLHGLYWGRWKEVGWPISLPFFFTLFLWGVLAKDLIQALRAPPAGRTGDCP